MAKTRILSLNPSYIGDPAQIDAQQASLTKGVQDFGTAQDTKMQDIYGSSPTGLQGQLAQNAGSIQQTFNQGNSNLQDAFGAANQQNESGLAGILAQLRQGGSSIGAGSDAMNEVIAGIGKGAANYQQRNSQKLTDRLASNTQLGTGMTALAKLGTEAAAKALAQGRKDLSERITSQVMNLGSSANMAKAGYLEQQSLTKQKETASAMKELIAEQKAAARQAASDARADARSNASNARADARASRSGGGSSGPSWFEKFDATNKEADRRAAQKEANKPVLPDDPRDVIQNDYMAQNFGPKATGYIEQRLAGKQKQDLKKYYRTDGMNLPLLETYVRRLQSTKGR